MQKLTSFPALLALALAVHSTADASTQSGRLDARMMRQPDVSATRIAFVYAGDIWVAPKSGGDAVRLTSSPGEESFPRFSPDGSLVAFSANYDGNQDIYVMPATGGVPRRITHHGAADRMVDWYPDGKHILYATTMTSYKDRFNQLYKVPVEGGLPEKLPMPYGEFGAFSPDGKTIAYTTITTDFRTWKRYRGGMNPDIWLFNLETLEARYLTQSTAADSIPMWHGDTVYFRSDRDANKRANIWAHDIKSNKTRQVTHFKEFDVHFPGIGPSEIIFENAGRLYLLDLKTEKYREVEITVTTDRATLKPRIENVSDLILRAAISPTGKRALFEARGDIFSAPAERGVVRNITRTSGTAERNVSWSPDGKYIAYFSDRTGEYELTLRHADLSVTNENPEQTLTQLGPGFRYRPQWSPDSKKILWIDQAMKIWVYDFDTKSAKQIDHQLWMLNSALTFFTVNWSPDSRWIAYGGEQTNRNSAIVLYDYQNHVRHQVTSGFYSDDFPVFDPDGKYLYFITGRTFKPAYSDLDGTWIYANTAVLAAVPLKRDVASPLAPRNDEETATETKEDTDKKDVEEKKNDTAKNGDKPDTEKPDDSKPDTDSDNNEETQTATVETNKVSTVAEKKDDKKPKPVEIDLDDFEQRIVILPPKPGRFADLAAAPGKVIYRREPRTGSDTERNPVIYYDLKEREEKIIIADSDMMQLSADRKKLLVRKDKDYAIIDVKEAQKMDKKIPTGSFESLIDPVAEWRQIFTDCWRIERDYFYDPNMHGVDWNAMRVRYGKLLDDAVTRWDLNYIIGELIGELNASHTYRGGGAVEKTPTRAVGYLGCDFVLTNGAYRIAKIINGAPWDSEVRSPLLQPGLTNVAEGDYLLAVNGEPLDITKDPWAAFQGLADKPVFLTVNDRPTLEGAKEILVQTLDSESRLRNLAWINENRLKIEQLSDGRIGYVYVPDTGHNGQNELVRQWRGQVTKQGLIIDERFNSGGQLPDRFVELLNRPLRSFWAVRDGLDWSSPFISHFGPKAMLINGWSGSGGDCFPYYFKQSKLGPLIGTRTWGGLIGIAGSPGPIDGGNLTVPVIAIFSTENDWIIENHGVDPDIEVIDDPGEMARGRDPQLERAVTEVLKAIRENPPQQPKRPKYPDRAN
ncbi:MAG TPA: PDZ domain-containing protein [Verrucomicrobiota bacterium]|nr:PDZ domain-containing protein [Verrucomicrobiota bacterium]